MEARFKIGEKFIRKGTKNNSTYKIEKITYEQTEPVYELQNVLFNYSIINLSESRLIENYLKI